MLLAVNFHYIQPEGRYPYPGIHPTTEEQLNNQLDELGRSFEFISGEDLVRAVSDRSPLPEHACLITFDDGMKEQFQVAAPLLEQHGVRGVFFICTQPLLENKALAVHKMHRLQATRPPDQFLSEVLEAADTLKLAVDWSQVDDEAVNRQYLYDNMDTKRVKFLLNHVIPFDDFKQLIDSMFQREIDEIEFCRQMYMDEKEIRSLSQNHTIGSHSHFHGPLASLPTQKLQISLTSSRRTLEAITGRSVNIISYPYGGPTAVSNELAQSADESGFVAGFSMERCVNRSLANPLLLGRTSTNDAPGGKSPLLVIDGKSEAFSFTPPMTAYRRVHFDERRYVEENLMAADGRGG